MTDFVELDKRDGAAKSCEITVLEQIDVQECGAQRPLDEQGVFSAMPEPCPAKTSSSKHGAKIRLVIPRQ